MGWDDNCQHFLERLTIAVEEIAEVLTTPHTENGGTPSDGGASCQNVCRVL